MNRIQLVELEDLPWFPRLFRDAGTGFLELMVRVSGHAKVLVPKVEEALRRAGETRVIVLAAGGGGPMGIVADELERRGLRIDGVLTDLYPNVPKLEAVAAASAGKLRVVRESVDAAKIPEHTRGLRLLFNAFHHFDRPLALSVLRAAVRDGQPIAIFEVVSREALPLVGMLMAPLNFALTLPLQRPFRWGWLPFTFLLPLLPAFVLFDGVVSWLRIWSVPELKGLVAELDAPGWTWDIGLIRLGGAPAHATYLVGVPPRAD
jgi:hypothetical protein